jgi:anti-anti-sigma factor
MSAGESASPRFAESTSSAVLPEFQMQDVVCEGEHTLMLSGELDLNSAPLLSVALRLICAEPATSAVVLDLSRLTFMDSTGIHAVLLAKELSAQHESEFSVVPGEAQVKRVMQITGLLATLPIRDGHHDANHDSTAAEGHA